MMSRALACPTVAGLALSLMGTGVAYGQGGNGMKLDFVVCPTSANNTRNGEGDMIELKDGSLLVAYTRWGGGGSDNDRAVIAGRISKDGGTTWGEDFVIQENDADMNVMSVSLLRLKSGEIMFGYLHKNSDADCRTIVRISSDEGKTWGPKVVADIGPGYHVQNNDRMVQLSTGRILSPVAWVMNGAKEGNYRSFCYYSDDGGKTWQASRTWVEITASSGAQEPGVVELKDGRVMMIFRSTAGYVGKSYSSDGGVTWSPAEMIKELPSPCGPQTIERIPSTGDLLLIWENNPNSPNGDQKRTPLTAAISRDDGQTWEHIRNIADDPNAGYCYTSCTFVGDDVLLTYYAPGGLHLSRMPVSWFYEK